MGCGCNKGKGAGAGMPTLLKAAAAPKVAARVAVYEVVKNGNVELTTTSPSAARSEARRFGASVRVTSRPAQPKELVS